jgi:hypothetical protein
MMDILSAVSYMPSCGGSPRPSMLTGPFPSAFMIRARGEGGLTGLLPAGRARHHRHQRMPVIGRGDEYSVDVFAIEQTPEILVQLRMAAHTRGGFIQMRGIDVA